jgi:very-short-patch-repair endonuclease
LVERQHGVVSRRQLLELGFTATSIEHRLATGRLHRVRRGVYAAGRRELGLEGRWMAAILACGPDAVLSHETAAAVWGIRRMPALIEVSVPAAVVRRHAGITVHRRSNLGPADLTIRQGIPVTSPICTLIDMAPGLEQDELEAVVNAADRLDLVDPDRLRRSLDHAPPRPGVGLLRALLDRSTFTLTDSALERCFLPLAHSAGLDRPLTRQIVNGYRVDFWWPTLGLIVETDGLRYHRTPAQQARDRVRDQIHTAAGLVSLRFTHRQVAFQPGYVVTTLSAVAARLRARKETPIAGRQ